MRCIKLWISLILDSKVFASKIKTSVFGDLNHMSIYEVGVLVFYVLLNCIPNTQLKLGSPIAKTDLMHSHATRSGLKLPQTGRMCRGLFMQSHAKPS